jgi:hypothetical protein
MGVEVEATCSVKHNALSNAGCSTVLRSRTAGRHVTLHTTIFSRKPDLCTGTVHFRFAPASPQGFPSSFGSEA